MNSKLQGFCAGIIESTLLVAALVIPVIINYYGFHIVGIPKAVVLVAMALLIAVVGIIALVEGHAAGLLAALRRPLVAAALATAIASTVATLGSIQPRLSIWGTGERGQGLVQILAVLLVFAGAAWVGRAGERRERMLAALLAASIPVSFYAIAQALQLEVIPGKVESTARAFGTLANPIFLGAFMMLLIPICLYRLVESVKSGRPLVFFGLALALVFQLLALILSDSRGPLLGLAAAAVITALALALKPGRRWLGWLTLGGMAAGLAFLILFNQPNTPLAPLRDLPVIGRFGEISTANGDSSGARLRIWRSARRLLVAEPARLVTGHGPEAMKLALLPYGEAYMASYNQRNRLVDRAHNVLLDLLITQGLLGALALLGMMAAFLHAAAGLAGLTPRIGDRRRLALFLAGGSALGALGFLIGRPLPGMAEALAVYAGALTLLGLLSGLGLYLTLLLLRADSSFAGPTRSGGSDATAKAIAAPEAGFETEAEAGRSQRFGLSLLAVGVAMVVEAAFGIQVVETQLVIWILAGLLVAAQVGPWRLSARSAPALTRRQRPEPEALDEEGSTLTIGWNSRSTGFGLALGALLSCIVFSLLVFASPKLAHTDLVLWGMLGLALVFGLMAAADAGESVLTTAIVALLCLGLYLLLRTFILSADPPDASLLWPGTLIWLLLLALAGGYWLREPAAHAPAWIGPAGLAYPVLVVPAVVLLSVYCIPTVRADIYFQSALATFDAALATDDAGLLNAAEQLYDRAAAANPNEDVYPLLFGERYSQLASLASSDLPAAAKAFQRAQALVEQAELLDPDMPYHKVNRGHLQLLFAQMILDSQPEQAAQAAANAEVPLQQAFDAVPYDPTVAGELALARWLKGDAEGALSVLEYSRDNLDPESGLTLRLLGQVYFGLGRLDDAEKAFETALTSARLNQQERMSILLAQGEIARQQGDREGAVARYEQVLQGGGGDWRLLFNLGLIYRDLGRQQEAFAALTQARQLAPPEAAEQVQAALDALRE
jgi:tetratricopeptide (TPR) repeat protein/O-antigen ligase